MRELNDEADTLATLAKFVQQIQGSGYRDRIGHPIENLIAHQDSLALLKLRGLA